MTAEQSSFIAFSNIDGDGKALRAISIISVTPIALIVSDIRGRTATEERRGKPFRVQINFSDGGAIQASDLATLIAPPSGECLQSLYLENVAILGDFSLVMTALSKVKDSLKVFTAVACPFLPTQENTTSLRKAMATLTTLEDVTLGLSAMDKEVGWQVMTEVVQQKKTVVEVCVGGFFPSPPGPAQYSKAITDFLSACGVSSTLRDLQLQGLLASQNVEDVGQLMLKNKSIKHLALVISPDANLQPLADAVKHNYTLHNVCVRVAHREPEQLPEPPTTLVDQIEKLEFYLSLNHLGRGRILREGATNDEWIDAISNQDMYSSLSTVFYFLRKNPALCYMNHQGGTKPSSDGKLNRRKNKGKLSNSSGRSSKRRAAEGKNEEESLPAMKKKKKASSVSTGGQAPPEGLLVAATALTMLATTPTNRTNSSNHHIQADSVQKSRKKKQECTTSPPQSESSPRPKKKSKTSPTENKNKIKKKKKKNSAQRMMSLPQKEPDKSILECLPPPPPPQSGSSKKDRSKGDLLAAQEKRIREAEAVAKEIEDIFLGN